MNKILSVNFIIPNNEDDYVEFISNMSLSDADIILFSPSQDHNYSEKNGYWYDEILHVLNLGKTVFVLLSNPHDDGSIYDFLPLHDVNFIEKSGINVVPQNKIAISLNDALNGFWCVECYLDIFKKTDFSVIFSNKHGDRILGAIFNEFNGNLVLIPNVDLNKTIKKGHNDLNEPKKIGNRFKQCLSDFHNLLNEKEENSHRPEWADYSEFELSEALQLLVKVEENKVVIETLIIQNDLLLESVKEKEILKNLLFETGKALENGVIEALKILGYQAENFDDGVLELDQVIVSPEGDRFIGECEGKDNKAIDISKFRQLQDNLNEDFHRDEVEEKAFGLLFGNPQRLINPTERTEDFTIKCKKGAEREKIGLINTVHLFEIAKYLSENNNESFRILCREEIKKQLGSVIKFPHLP